ncbi:MAG: hypothetical protein IT463_00505, partial [Planctomycetes bacterium]|nr:hypothetical protein [Planctomycetota bacterium]
MLFANSTTPTQAGKFTIQNTSATTAVTLNSVTLTASGTGNDSNAYSQVALYRDTNGSGGYNAGDTIFGTAATAFSADNGTRTFTPVSGLSIAGGVTETFFVVVTMNGTTQASPGQTFKTRVSSISSSVASDALGLPSSIMEGITIINTALNVAVTTGTTQVVANNATGAGGNGIQAATFTITNTNTGGTSLLDAIQLGSSGTGNDSTAYTSVEVWQESNATAGFQTGDTQVGSSAAGFSGDNGTATFTYATQQSFAASEARTYYVVVKLNGTATANQTFNYNVQDITVGSGSFKSGVPSATMNGLRIEQPTLAVGGATGTNGNVYANETGSGNGYQAASFTITSGSEGTATLTGVTITASGTGNDSTDYSEITLWRESTATAGFQTGDTQIGTAATQFSADNGTASFTVQAGEQSFAAGTARTYYIVIKLNGAASPAETFNFSVSSIATSGGTTSSGTPTSAMNGVTILAPSFTYADASPATAQAAYLGSTGNVVQKFSVSYPNGPNNNQTSITVTALGTGHDVNDLSSVELWLDDGNGTYSATSDTQITSGAYSADNGTIAFNLTGQTAFAAPETRTYFVIYDFNLTGTNNSTYQCYVSASSGHSTGTTISGIPTPSITGTAGLILNSNVLTATLNGPGTAL